MIRRYKQFSPAESLSNEKIRYILISWGARYTSAVGFHLLQNRLFAILARDLPFREHARTM